MIRLAALACALLLAGCAQHDPMRLPLGWRIGEPDYAQAEVAAEAQPLPLVARANADFRRAFRGTVYDGRTLSPVRAFSDPARGRLTVLFDIQVVSDACAAYVFDQRQRIIDRYLSSC